jgi:hypothetical protein
MVFSTLVTEGLKGRDYCPKLTEESNMKLIAYLKV